VKIGDNVLVQQGDEDDDYEKQPAVGEVVELFQSVGLDPNRTKIRWYFTFKEIPKAYQNQIGKLIINKMPKKSLCGMKNHENNYCVC